MLQPMTRQVLETYIPHHILPGRRRHDRKIDDSNPENIFPVAVHSSPGTIVFRGVVLGELGSYDREIMHNDPANIFLIVIDTLAVTWDGDPRPIVVCILTPRPSNDDRQITRQSDFILL